jgi:hypothetical protein
MKAKSHLLWFHWPWPAEWILRIMEGQRVTFFSTNDGALWAGIDEEVATALLEPGGVLDVILSASKQECVN